MNIAKDETSIENQNAEEVEQENSDGLDFSIRAHKSNAVSRYMNFLRIIGLGHILFGIYVWFFLIGGSYKATPFVSLDFFTQIEVIFAAIISCVLGLGLWLLTPWGVTLWILHTTIIAIANIFNENPLISLPIFAGLQAILLIYYILLRRKYESFI